MSDFRQKMQQAQNGYQARQNGLGYLTPAGIDSIVDTISTHLENDIIKQASGRGMIHTQSEGSFISRRYEYRYYYTAVPVKFQQASCTAIYHHGGSEHDWDNERYIVGVRNLGEAKQIAIAIIQRLYANKMQVNKPMTGTNISTSYFNFYTVDEIVRLIQKSKTLELDGFSTAVYFVVSKTQKR